MAVQSRLAEPPPAPAWQPDFQAQLKHWQARIENELAARLPSAQTQPTRLHEAIRYSVLGGGKRVRPALV
jgi:farnesyl diphosphate synthase